MRKCRLWLTKEEIKPEVLAGATVVVIDVLLATTTLVTLMERGAQRVYPVGSVDEALKLKQELGADSCLTGGEEGGRRVDEFDCGHLPDDYPSEMVKDKDIVFLSTNGTRAIRRAENAETVLLANLRNAPAVADYLNTLVDQDVYIICAGSMGNLSLEDFMCASIIISRLNLGEAKIDDAIRIALEQKFEEKDNIMEILEKSRVGQNTIKNDMYDLLKFTGELGASNSIVRMKERQLEFMPVENMVQG